MKVILTEEQLKEVIREQVVEENFISSLLGQRSMNGIVKQIVIALLAGTISLASVPLILGRLEQSNPAIENTDQGGLLAKIKAVYEKIRNKEAKITDQMKTDATDSNFAEKVKALKSYMEMAAKNQNYDPETIQISPEAMIEACNQTGFDLPLLIAQAHLESCFGLTPRARRTNSVFSVGSYDNGKNAATYATQNDCILPYIRLIQGKYLNDKTVDDILKPGAFVNGLNKRYATDTSYERKVKSIRNKIISKYPILAS
jgi:flagellum-specific peptidoglycan hydrolase FlgJ